MARELFCKYCGDPVEKGSSSEGLDHHTECRIDEELS